MVKLVFSPVICQLFRWHLVVMEAGLRSCYVNTKSLWNLSLQGILNLRDSSNKDELPKRQNL